MHPERFVSRPGRALGVSALLFAVVLVLAVLVPDHPLALERHWARWMQDVETHVLTRSALVLNAAGMGLWRYLAVAAIGLVLACARRGVALAAFLTAELFTPLLVTGIKALAERPRPGEPLVVAHGFSYPSGHAAYAGATTVALVLLFTAPGGRRHVGWVLAAALVAAMAWSRTYLQVHWLGDVVAGSLLGVSVALAVFAGLQRLVGEPTRS